MDAEATHDVRVEDRGTLRVPDNAVLLDALMRSQNSPYRFVARPFHCGGKGRCGTCRVQLIAGTGSPRTPHELLRLGTSAGAVRLACQVAVREELSIRLFP